MLSFLVCVSLLILLKIQLPEGKRMHHLLFCMSLTGPSIVQRLIFWSAFGLDTILTFGDQPIRLGGQLNWGKKLVTLCLCTK